MLKSVIENYLISIKEIQFFAPFKVLLENLGFYDIHLLHGSTEFGKDFIAKKVVENEISQYCFQLKMGDINLHKFTNEVKPQLFEIITNNISHPNFNDALNKKIIFVTTGLIKSPATVSFQQFNNFVIKTFNIDPIQTWERDKLLTDFLKVGIEPFFEFHKSPEFVSRFFELFSNITKEYEFTSFDIINYTDYWLNLDLAIKENKLQVLFEGYFFSKLFMEKENYYCSVLFLASISRGLIKSNIFKEFENLIIESIDYNITSFCKSIGSKNDSEKQNYFIGNNLLAILVYPSIVLKSLELVSLKILLLDEVDDSFSKLFFEMLEQKGATRPLSDNYGIAIVFISLALLKLQKIELLKKYINNTVVWLCDRYEQNGVTQIGSNPDEEYEQILSEYLTGLKFDERKTSFLASIILDICYFLNDSELYANIANDFRAVEIIPEYYHVNKKDELFDYNNNITQLDHNFSLTLQDEFTSFVRHRKKSNFKLLKNEKLLMMFLLKDRYFPESFSELIQ